MAKNWDVEADYPLNEEQLDDKYSPEGDGEHPFFQRVNWRQAVAQEETLQGYWRWVTTQIWMFADEGE